MKFFNTKFKIYDLFSLNVNDPRNFAMYKSVDTMLAEKESVKNYKFRIHPHSKFRVFWELFYCGFIFINVLYSFFSLTIIRSKSSIEFLCVTCQIFVDLPLLMNIIFNFITGFYRPSQEEAIMTFSAIGRKYISALFWFDILGLIFGSPLFAHLLPITKIHDDLHLNLVVLIGRCLGVGLRVFTPWYYWKKRVSKYFLLDNLISSVIEYFTFFPIIVAVLAGIAFFINYDHFQKSPGNTIKEITLNYLYIVMKVWTSSVVLSDLSHLSLSAIDTCLIVFPYVRYFIISALLIIIFWSNQGASDKYNEVIDNLNEYLQQVKISSRLKIRITKYYDVTFDGKYYDEQELLDCASSELREDIASLKLSRMREEISVLKVIPLEELIQIGRLLVQEVYLANDIIAYSGSPHDRMYLIARGSVALYTDSAYEICHMANNNYILVNGVLPHLPLVAINYTACETTIVYSLSRTDYLSVIDTCPIFDKLINFTNDVLLEMVEFIKEKDEEINHN